MDFGLDGDQRAILEAVGKLLDAHAGPDRARQLRAEDAYDTELDTALREAGFVDLVRAEGTGLLEAALVLDLVARRAGLVAYGAVAVVAAGLSEETLPGPIALANAGDGGPVRYGAHARTLLIADGDDVRVKPLAEHEAEPVAAGFGFPMARVSREGGDRLSGAGDRMRALWRIALAAETAGTMRAALDFTLAYVKSREQFGRAIGSFQALQHRLAESTVLVEASRWLAWEAAWLDAPTGAAATAAAQATSTAERIFHEVHQMNGSMGFTREHDLHVWSMRLPTLRLLAGGTASHRRAVARSRWL